MKLGWQAKESGYLWNTKKTFLSKLLPVTFFAQQVQKDKTHHRKIQKISDLGVYLVLLSEFIPGSVVGLPHYN